MPIGLNIKLMQLPRTDTIMWHYREWQNRHKTLMDPIASIFAWMRGLLHRAKLDGNDALREWCHDPEAACVEVIDRDGVMTKDLAVMIHGKGCRGSIG